MATFVSSNIKKRLFDVGQYYAMLDTGILTPEDRIELIHGEIIEMPPIGSRHAGYVKGLNKLLNNILGDYALIAVQDPIRLSAFSEPEPDLAILKPRDDFYTESHPTPEEVFFLIEVVDTSISYDYEVKLPMYAAAGIEEVRVLDVSSQIITQHLKPDGNIYLQHQIWRKGDVLK